MLSLRGFPHALQTSESSYFSKITSREECYAMLQIVPGLLLVGNLRFVLLVDLSFSVLHFSSVVFQSRLTFIQLGCFFLWQWLLSFLLVLSDCFHFFQFVFQ